MGASHRLFKNKRLNIAAVLVAGLCGVTDISTLIAGTTRQDLDYGTFAICTGSSDLPDLTYAGGAVTLIPNNQLPNPASQNQLRFYLTRVDIDVQGVVALASVSTNAALVIADNAGCPLVYVPLNGLRGEAAFTFPDTDTAVPMLLGSGQGATISSYVPATGVITFSQAMWSVSEGSIVGIPVTVYAGAGQGQSALITAFTATTCTVSPAFQTPIDTYTTGNTSVLAIWYYQVSAESSSTVFTLQGYGTPFTANALDNGFYAVIVAGQSVGTVRPILANTTAGQLTVNGAMNTVVAVASSLVHITNESNLFGALDLCVDAKWAAATPGQGLQAYLQGTFSAGSNIRIYVEGFFAP